MTTNYWTQHAELHRKADGQELVPDAPIRRGSRMVADGTLGEMLDRVSALSPANRLQHVILVGGGALSDTVMEEMLTLPRAAQS